MKLYDIIVIAISLAMDCFAISICKGFSLKKIEIIKILKISVIFGLFHGIMPLIGYFLGTSLSVIINDIDHWIAFILLVIIGLKMIKESMDEKDEKENNDSFDLKTILILAIASSIDSLVVGVTFYFFDVNIIISAMTISIITFILSYIGVIIGNKFGNKFNNKAELFGGIVLILLGIKILLEHLGILNF